MQYSKTMLTFSFNCLYTLQLDDGQPLEYLSEMRQISVIFMNLSLEESANICSLMQSLFEKVYKHVQSLEGQSE